LKLSARRWTRSPSSKIASRIGPFFIGGAKLRASGHAEQAHEAILFQGNVRVNGGTLTVQGQDLLTRGADRGGRRLFYDRGPTDSPKRKGRPSTGPSDLAGNAGLCRRLTPKLKKKGAPVEVSNVKNRLFAALVVLCSDPLRFAVHHRVIAFHHCPYLSQHGRKFCSRIHRRSDLVP
jgi:hypothetical protein